MTKAEVIERARRAILKETERAEKQRRAALKETERAERQKRVALERAENRKAKLLMRVDTESGAIFILKKAYEEIMKNANVTGMRTERNKLILTYESKSGKVKGEMSLNNLN